MNKIYWDRPNSRFYKLDQSRLESRLWFLNLGEKTWHLSGLESNEPTSLEDLEEWEVTKCNNGHEKCPENLMMGNDGYLRCRLCRRGKKDPKLPEVESTFEEDIRIEFNSNTSVRRDKSVPGWGTILISSELSRSEARRLGEALIRLAMEE